MTQPAETFTVEIPASQLPVKTLEERRQQIYALKSDTIQRALQLTKMVEHLPVGKTSVYDRILEQALYDHNDKTVISTERYRMVLDNDGLVTDIQHVLPIEEDEQTKARAKAMAARVPWGPKKNGSSFRTRNLDSARPRMH